MQIIHNPLNVPSSKTVDRSQMTLSPIGRICFRGDSRSPDDVFAKGFKLREIITEKLFKKIEDIQTTHLDNKGFNPQKFIEDVDALTEIIKEEATEGLVKEFLGLPSFLKDGWISQVVDWVANDSIVVIEDNQKEDLKKGIYRPFESQNFISLSKRFKSALLFPVPGSLTDKPLQDKTYLYAVYVEEGYDVHMQGIVSSLINAHTSEKDLLSAFKKANPHLSKEQVEDHIKKITVIQNIMNISLEDAVMMYAEEIVCKSIPREQIIAAVEVDRQLRLNDENQPSGTFKLKTEVTVNEDCTRPEKTIKQVEDFLKQEIKINQQAYDNKPMSRARWPKIKRSLSQRKGFILALISV
ncbi:hypothetical protein TUM19329_03090 [Legionella antarctica]|uniref:Uncharacterized protein n=2 Tax=Legionella antarctica TaxID=2708020 RepID=A0A6F8T0N2_9GAMM|nr:hypothetical protein TUM19329_03090 [Legionella antarctica]